MFTKCLAATTVALIVSCAGAATASIICPDSSYCTVSFTDPAKERVTIAPNGAGETFAGTGITIRVFLKNCNGQPLVGVPWQEVVIYNDALCICPGGNTADAATDQNGMTAFSGTIRGGGCVESLTIYAGGVAIATIPVKTNSPDHSPSTPCLVDAADLAGLAAVLGRPDLYDVCKDYNESGLPKIDAGDLSYFAAFLGAECQ